MSQFTVFKRSFYFNLLLFNLMLFSSDHDLISLNLVFFKQGLHEICINCFVFFYVSCIRTLTVHGTEHVAELQRAFPCL